MTASEVLETRGHLMDTGVLARVLDDVLAYGGDYRIDRLDVGRAHDDESYARITVSAADDEALQRLLMRLQTHGVNQTDPGEAVRRSMALLREMSTGPDFVEGSRALSERRRPEF